jgi:hypothetical protein
MSKRIGTFFRPAKKNAFDYNVNYMLDGLVKIRRQWDKSKRMIIEVLSSISGKIFTPIDDDLAMCGIVDPAEAADRANMRTLMSQSFAEHEKKDLPVILYAQVFHQMASHIEALFLKTLTRCGYEGDKFNRNVLYAFKGNNQENVKTLDGFIDLDKMYAIWNFIKHNSLSTFGALKDGFPTVVKEGEYSQGDLACYFVNFDDDLIESILKGIAIFIRAYCRLVFKEDCEEAGWNSEEFFLAVVRNEIRGIEDPLGVDSLFGE